MDEPNEVLSEKTGVADCPSYTACSASPWA